MSGVKLRVYLKNPKYTKFSGTCASLHFISIMKIALRKFSIIYEKREKFSENKLIFYGNERGNHLS